MKKIHLLFISLLISSSLIAQKTTDALQHYFEEPQELIHLSLNKTSFIPGEHIWFQGFVANPKNKFLSSIRQNIHVSIFDQNGNKIEESLHLANAGTFSGDFEITSLPPGKYQIQAATSFLYQFENPYVHSQAFYVLGGESTNESTDFSTTQKNVHWLPESGNLLLNVGSNLGIKLADQNGTGIPFKATLLANDNKIASFKSNSFGLSKVRIEPRDNITYSVEFTTKDETFTKIVPSNLIKEKGFIIQHQPIDKHSRAIRLVSTFHEDVNPSEHSLLLHQDGKFVEIPIFLNENGEYSFVLKNENIFEGVNTLTYLYKGNPVAERLIFNRPKQLSSDQIEIGKSFSVNRDSMLIKFNLNDLNKKFTKVSISVLDATNKVNERPKNISSSFYLEPYVGGMIQQPAYYFTQVTPETEQNLDLLLLTQGWSRFSWDEIMAFSKEGLQLKESGLKASIEIGGGITKKWNKLLMFAGIYNDEMVFDVDKENNTLEFSNFYPIKNEAFNFSLIDAKGKFKSPKKLRLESELNEFESIVQATDFSNFVPYRLPKSQSLLSEDELTPFADEEAELLNEVKLSARNSSDDYFVSHKEDYQLGFNAVRLDIDEDAANSFPFVTDYLAAKGWRVSIDQSGSLSIINNRGVSSSIAEATSETDNESLDRSSNNLGSRSSFAPLLVVNNVRFYDFSILEGRRTDDFEYIIYDKTAYGVGLDGQGGVIRLRLRETPIFTQPTINGMKYITAKAANGFAYPKEYFNPSYEMLDLQTYKDVAAIAWFNDMFTEDNSFTIQHLHTDAEAYEYYIEGISEDGLLINEKITVPTKL